MDHTYDPIQYWGHRPEPNAVRGLMPEIVAEETDLIRSFVGRSERVLDYGPGVGRTFGAYTKASEVWGYDISPLYVERVTAAARHHRLKAYYHVVGTAHVTAPLPFADNAFDAAVACQVLLHQRTEHIEAIVRNLCCCAAKVLIIAGRGGASPHVFNHDYRAIFASIGLDDEEVEVVQLHRPALSDRDIFILHTGMVDSHE